jgi:hypothetical protein
MADIKQVQDKLPAVKPRGRIVALEYAVPAAIIILVIIGAAIFIHNKLSKPAGSSTAAFVIDHKSYSKKLISAMAGYVVQGRPQSRQQAARNIFTLYETEVASQKAGIKPDAAELAANQPSTKPPQNDAEKQYLALAQYNAALGDSYGRYAVGDDQGYSFVFDFSRYMIPPPAGDKPIAGYGNKSLIAKDKSYAYQQAQADYRDYKQGKISAAALLKKLSADPNLSFNPSSGVFGPSNPGLLNSQLYYSDIYTYVTSQTKPQLSGVRLGKVPIEHTAHPKNYADGYYYFVDLQKASRVVTDPSGLVNAQLKKLQAVYYGL